MTMIRNQPLHGALHDSTHDKALQGSCLSQTVLVSTGNATHKTYRKIRTLILSYIAAEEVTQTAYYQLTYLRHVKVTVDERRQRSQETISHRLTIDTGNDIGHCQIHITLELSH